MHFSDKWNCATHESKAVEFLGFRLRQPAGEAACRSYICWLGVKCSLRGLKIWGQPYGWHLRVWCIAQPALSRLQCQICYCSATLCFVNQRAQQMWHSHLQKIDEQTVLSPLFHGQETQKHAVNSGLGKDEWWSRCLNSQNLLNFQLV